MPDSRRSGLTFPVAGRRQFLIGAVAIAASAGVPSMAPATELRVENVDEYRLALGRLSQQHYKVALVDIGAEWCEYCATIDGKIMPDPGVRRAMAHVGLIKVDVTRMDMARRQLLQALDADGPPTVFIVDTGSGREYTGTRSVGTFQSDDLIRRLQPFSQ